MWCPSYFSTTDVSTLFSAPITFLYSIFLFYTSNLKGFITSPSAPSKSGFSANYSLTSSATGCLNSCYPSEPSKNGAFISCSPYDPRISGLSVCSSGLMSAKLFLTNNFSTNDWIIFSKSKLEFWSLLIGFYGSFSITFPTNSFPIWIGVTLADLISSTFITWSFFHLGIYPALIRYSFPSLVNEIYNIIPFPR